MFRGPGEHSGFLLRFAAMAARRASGNFVQDFRINPMQAISFGKISRKSAKSFLLVFVEFCGSSLNPGRAMRNYSRFIHPIFLFLLRRAH
jgi:hypothetical protein